MSHRTTTIGRVKLYRAYKQNIHPIRTEPAISAHQHYTAQILTRTKKQRIPPLQQNVASHAPISRNKATPHDPTTLPQSRQHCCHRILGRNTWGTYGSQHLGQNTRPLRRRGAGIHADAQRRLRLRRTTRAQRVNWSED